MTPQLPRLLLAVHAYPDGGGISSIVENFVIDLGRRYDVHLAIVDEQPGRRDRLVLADDHVHTLGYSEAMNPLLMPTSLIYSARVGRFLRGLVKALAPAALIVQDGLHLPFPGALATAGTATPLAIMDHGTLTNTYDREWQKMTIGRAATAPRRAAFGLGFALDAPWRAARWRLGLRAAKGAWYVGHELEPFFGRAGGRARRYSQTVPGDFNPPTPDQRIAARQALGLDQSAFVANVVGRLDGEKGLDLILDAAEAVAPDHPGFQLLVAGDGTLETWFADELGRRGFGDRIRMLGRLDRPGVERLHHASDLHVYAGTISCGLSMCLIEAMACGVIPLVSDVPVAQRALVADAGWVFGAGDRSELERCLREALDMPDGQRDVIRGRVRGRLASQDGASVPELVHGLTAAA